ncbi:unnamed protein product [Heterobilharzia americana]|nr:unnamed protein product [Heterobilharzia americana]
MPKSNYNLYNNTYSYNISPFIYNETIQEKDYWNHDNLLDDIQQETISCIPDYPVSSVQSSFNSYWLKQQSTSYNKHNINNINDNYIYNENNVKSYSTNQIMNNYSKDIDSMNCDYYKQYDEQSKYPINPILASTYRSVGSSNPYSYQSSVVVDSYKSNECSKSYYDDCPSYYLSTNSDHTNNNNNNNSSSYHCQTHTNTSTKHTIM